MPRTINKTNVGAIEVSTIDADGMLVRWPETCIFYPNGNSDVVATYNSRDEAVMGHADVVANLVKDPWHYRATETGTIEDALELLRKATAILENLDSDS